jgi:hypothetical protein
MHFRFSHDELIQKKLEIQQSSPNPMLSDDFLYGVSDFIGRYNGVSGRLGTRNTENVPPELMNYIAALGQAAFPDAFTKFACIRLTNGTDIDDAPDAYQAALKTIQALHARFGLTASCVSLTDSKGKISDVYLTCLPGKFIKKSSNEWAQEINPKAIPQFFAMALAEGLVNEQMLEENGVMLGIQGAETRAHIKQLKDEGLQPILEKPLHVRDSSVKGR